MIDAISTRELRRLADVQDPHCVSIYLPTHPSGAETAQDPIRLKNLAARAGHELRAIGLPVADVTALSAPLTRLHDDAAFWAHQGRGLAVFVTRDETRTYRLPDPVEELVVVADRLHLKPLLPCVTSGELFHVLALSQNRVRLLRGSRYSVHEIALDEIPESVAEALRNDDREPQLQSHSATRTGTGQVAATFHGQGAAKETRDVDLDRFLDVVDAGVRRLVGVGSAPLVLAGVRDVVARFRRTTDHPYVVGGEIIGNPERMSAAELHDRAWPLVGALFATAQREAHERVSSDSVPTGAAVDEVVLAAHDGRVRTLFVAVGLQCWGRFDAEARQVEQHDEREPGDRDLLDVAALDTLLAGGNVFAVPPSDVPGDGPVIAEFRY